MSRITKLVVETVGNDEAVDFMTADDMQLHASTSDVSITRLSTEQHCHLCSLFAFDVDEIP